MQGDRLCVPCEGLQITWQRVAGARRANPELSKFYRLYLHYLSYYGQSLLVKPVEQLSETTAMICPKCHTDYPDNTQTCTKCGQTLATGGIATGPVAAVPAREVAKAPAARSGWRHAIWLAVPLLGCMIWWANTAARSYRCGSTGFSARRTHARLGRPMRS